MIYVASDRATSGSVVARILVGSSKSDMYRGCLCCLLIASATSSDLTSSVVGMPCLAQTVLRARPKLPPPMTATRTGYGGIELEYIESCDLSRLWNASLLLVTGNVDCRHETTFLCIENPSTYERCKSRTRPRLRSHAQFDGNEFISFFSDSVYT